jgi:membrane fusion protein (multidrug efflux system)
MRPLLLIILAIVVLYLLKVFILDEDLVEPGYTPIKKESNASAGLPVDIYIAKEENKTNTIYSSGTIIPNEEVNLTSETSGRLTKLNIKEGGYVQKGQLIAKLNDEELVAQIKKVDYEEQLAEQTKTRQKKLLEINAISKEEYDMAVTRVNTLSADKDFLRAQLEKTSIIAPFHGRMGLKNISNGAYITPNEVITTLVQTDPIKIDFTIPEKYTQKITIGQEVQFTIDGSNQIFTATVIALDSKIDENLRTLRVRARTPNKKGLLYPGNFVRVIIPLGDESSIMIPTEAIIPILKGKKVFVMEDGLAIEKFVKTGLRTELRIQVEEGLSIGDSVVVSALMTVKPNMEIFAREIIQEP